MKIALGIFWVMAVFGILGILVLRSDPNYEAKNEEAKPSPHAENTIAEKASPEDNGGKSGRWAEYKKKVEQNEKIITATSTIFIAGFTVALAFATFFLWLATRDLVKDAKHNAGRQLRAYVFLGSAKISDPLGKPAIAVQIKNFGQTPAYGTVFWIDGVLREYPLKGDLIRRSKGSPMVDLGPTGALSTTIHWNGPIQEADKIALKNGSKAIYIFGKITYRDSFDNEWSTEFRFIEGGENSFRPEGGDLPHSIHGNKAT